MIIEITDYKEFKKIYKNNYEFEIEKEEIIIKKCSNGLTEIFSNILNENELNILNSLDYEAFIIKLGFKEKISENENLLKYYKTNMENEKEYR
jgi:sulfur transfer protein SufE